MKKILFLLTALTVALFASCQREPDAAGGPGKGKLRLSVAVDRLLFDGGDPTRSGGATRAAVETQEGEDQIGSLYLAFFEADNNRQGSFVDYVEVDLGSDFTDMNLQTRIADIDLSGTSIDPAAAYNILAVANISDTRYVGDGETVLSWMGQLAGMTEEEAAVNRRGFISAAHSITANGLLMNGRVEKTAGQTQLNLNLTRNNARLDVVNNTRETYDLVSTTIWNAFPASSVWDGETLMDYSPSAPRVRRFYGLDNSANESGVAGADGLGNLLGDIRGGLYVFENQVISPEKNDNITTCLIIGLLKRGETVPTYYRANVVLEGKSQLLRRNHAYALTIRSVSGPGAATEELAYIGKGNTLEYTIGSWNLDDNGLIVKDDYSILSIPTKVANIGRDASNSNFSIYTFTSLSSPAPLTIRSQTYTPSDGGIRARLDGNTLVIEADPLAFDQTERRGVIMLSYAGLETSMTVVQSGAADDYLRVYLPEGGIPRFLAFGGIPSGLIRVEATGLWTAQLYMDGFSFGSVPNSTPITTLPSTSGLVVDNRFRVYTNSTNDTGSVRDAFIVVSLNKDPENYQSLIRISQASAGAIKLLPDDQTTVTFDGTGQLETIPGMSNVNVFNVLPGWNDQGTVINVWSADIIADGIHSDPGHFNVAVNYDATVLENNTVTVTAADINTFGRTLSAVLRIYTDPTTYTDITLFQNPVTLNLVPSITSPVPTTGGQTALIRVDGPGSLAWSAVIKPVASSASDGRQLIHHEATLVDQNGNAIATDGTAYPMSTQFRVVFPKVYYPNRDIPITVDVDITVAGVTQTMQVTQTTLTARPMIGFCMGNTGTSYGQFGSIYNAGWEGRNNGGYNGGTYGLSQIPGYSFANPESGSITGTNIAANVTYLHVTPGDGQTTSFDWTTINNYLDTRDAWTMFQPQSPTSYASFNGANSPTKRNGAGYQNMLYSPSGTNSTVLTDMHSNTKIYKFIMDRGNQPLSPADITSEFYTDDIHTIIPGPWPSTAVVMMTRVNNSNYAMLIIDVKNKFMFLGESQVFWYNPWLTNNRGTFLDNLMFFVSNASKYGSHFTDLLLEDGQSGSQPAPWDDYWGDNRGGREGGNGVGSK